MRMLEFFRSSAVRVALAFVLVTTVAATAVFALVYLRIGEANEARNRLILETEAAKSINRSVDELRTAFEVRLTNDLRRIDYAALFDTSHKFMFGNIETLLPLPVDGKSHYVAATHVPGSDNRIEPAIFVALERPDGNVMLLGRSLLETLAFRRIVQSALLAGLAPLLRLARGSADYPPRRSSRRLPTIHDAIARIMKGDTDLRLPIGS